jgi:transglycosylase-like protein
MVLEGRRRFRVLRAKRAPVRAVVGAPLEPVGLPAPRRGSLRRSLLVSIIAVGTVAFVSLDIAWLLAPNLDHLERQVTQRLKPLGDNPVSLASVAPVMRKAIVAAEDERFYDHHGVDLVGVVRAFAYDLSHFSTSEGASTITEQVAETIYLHGNDGSPWEKAREAMIAVRLETDYSKRQILSAYLNSAYFGHHATGIAAASRRYFGATPSQLSLAEASLLAGLPQDPGGYDPFTNPVDARQRQAEVLRAMVRNHLVSLAAARRTASLPLHLAGGRTLRPLRSPDVTPDPPLALLQLIGGLVLSAFGIVGAWFVRRRHPSAVWSWIGAAVAFGGVFIAAGSVR